MRAVDIDLSKPAQSAMNSNDNKEVSPPGFDKNDDDVCLLPVHSQLAHTCKTCKAKSLTFTAKKSENANRKGAPQFFHATFFFLWLWHLYDKEVSVQLLWGSIVEIVLKRRFFVLRLLLRNITHDSSRSALVRESNDISCHYAWPSGMKRPQTLET